MTNTVPDAEPMSRRDVFLTVALAVARDGMPAPDEVALRDGRPGLEDTVSVSYDAYRGHGNYCRAAVETLAAAEQAARILGLTDYSDHPDGIVWTWRERGRHGWTWEVVAHTPKGTIYTPGQTVEPSGLAAQVVAAVAAAAEPEPVCVCQVPLMDALGEHAGDCMQAATA